jgi:preprotein translocase subunit SecG
MEILLVAQIVLAVVITIVILMQRGTSGLGTVFGGSVADTYRSKRGLEAVLHNLTIILGVLFIANSIAIVIISAS